jgi:hypothetical protein
MYGGFLRFIPEKGREVKVPYFGVLGALYDLPTLDVEKLHIKDSNGKSYKQDDTYHFKLSDKNVTAPTISFGFVTPTRIFNIDLINMQGKRVGYIMPSYKYVEVDLVPQDMSEVNPWNGLLVSEEDHLSNETSFMVSPGTYQIRWSALRLFGDANKGNDWIVHKSGPIEIEA